MSQRIKISNAPFLMQKTRSTTVKIHKNHPETILYFRWYSYGWQSVISPVSPTGCIRRERSKGGITDEQTTLHNYCFDRSDRAERAALIEKALS